MAHIRQQRPDSGLCFQANVLETLFERLFARRCRSANLSQSREALRSVSPGGMSPGWSEQQQQVIRSGNFHTAFYFAFIIISAFRHDLAAVALRGASPEEI